MKENIFEELGRMKNLFSYQKGKVISEQYMNTPTNANPNQLAALNAGYGPVSAQKADELAAQGLLGPELQKQQSFRSYAKNRQGNNLGNDPVAAKNASLMNPGETASDYFRNPDGTIKVTDLDPVTVSATRKKTTPTQTKTQFTKSTGFPLLFQQSGNLISQLQTALGINPTGNFWNKTEQAVNQKAKELGFTYDRKTGVDENLFDTIVYGGSPSKRPKMDAEIVKTTSTAGQVPAAAAPTINASATPAIKAAEQTPEQLFNSLVSIDAIETLTDENGNGRRRIKYKKTNPAPDVLASIDKFLAEKGYTRIKQKVKGYGKKLVWENPNL